MYYDLSTETLALLEGDEAYLNGFIFYLLSSPLDVPVDLHLVPKYNLEALIGDVISSQDEVDFIAKVIEATGNLLGYEVKVEAFMEGSDFYVNIITEKMTKSVLLKQNVIINYVEDQLENLRDEVLFEKVYLSGSQLIEFVKMIKLHNPKVRLSYSNGYYILKDFVLVNLDQNTLPAVLEVLEQDTI